MALPRTADQRRSRPRRDRGEHDEELLARLLPQRRSTRWLFLLDLAVLFLSSAFGLILFSLFRSEPGTILVLLVVLGGFVVVALQCPLISLAVFLPVIPAAMTGDVVVASYLVPLASLWAFAFVFGRHYCTAFTCLPVSLEQMERIRRPFRRSLVSLIVLTVLLMPALVAIPELPVEDRRVLLAACYRLFQVLLLVLAFLYWLLPPRRKMRTHVIGLKFWTTYNTDRTEYPGVFRSPAGSVSLRLLLLNLTVILFAGAEVAPLALEEDLPALTEFRQMFLRVPWPLVPLPVLTVLLGTFVLNRARLVKARRAFEGSEDNEWQALVERQTYLQEQNNE